MYKYVAMLLCLTLVAAEPATTQKGDDQRSEQRAAAEYVRAQQLKKLRKLTTVAVRVFTHPSQDDAEYAPIAAAVVARLKTAGVEVVTAEEFRRKPTPLLNVVVATNKQPGNLAVQARLVVLEPVTIERNGETAIAETYTDAVTTSCASEDALTDEIGKAALLLAGRFLDRWKEANPDLAK